MKAVTVYGAGMERLMVISAKITRQPRQINWYIFRGISML